MKQIRLNLDELTDWDIILELEKRANGGALSRALYRVICEWFLSRTENSPIQDQNSPIQDQDSTESGPAELAESLNEIEEGW